MEITNLTTGTHTSKKMRWDSNLPFVRGNYLSSYYSACQSSRVPIHFNCNNFTYIVGRERVYRTTICENKEEVVEKMKCEECWEYSYIYNENLKDLISQDNWEILETRTTYVKKEIHIQEVEVLNFDREVTWHFGVVPVGKCFYEDEILLSEGDFVFTETEVFHRKNNDEYLKIFDHMVEEFEYEGQVYRVVEFKGKFCLFTQLEEKAYGYEFNEELWLPEALEYIGKKAKYDKINNTSLEEAVDWLVQSRVELTVKDSYAVGNCKPGTQAFIEKHFNGKECLTIDEKSKPFILKLAQENRLFSNVLKKKYTDKF